MPEVYSSSHKPHKSHQTQEVEKKLHSIAKPSKNAMSAFSYFPPHVKFVGTDNQEKIILLLRRHPITTIPTIFTAFFMVIAPIFVGFIPDIATYIPVNYQLVAMLFWYMITLAFIIEQFLNWFFNVHIITDERVFDVDFTHLVHREITDANIDQIQDVTTQMSGVLHTTFNYGNVIIQTAAQIPQIEYTAVPNPDKVAQVLRELRVQEEIEKIEGRVR